MIKWIFFDIGNVILNDDPAMTFLYLKIYQAIKNEGNNIDFQTLMALREKSILEQREGKHFVNVALNYLTRKKWARLEEEIKSELKENWLKLSPLIPGMPHVIRELAKKYNLGLIANQPLIVLDVLRHYGLSDFFKVHGISESVGFSKPDPKFFQWALREANCRPEHAIMIGDRIDNDIAPAKSMGMKTIWLPLPPEEKGYQPEGKLEKIYFESLKKASISRLQPRNDAEKPDETTTSVEEILEKVERISRS